MDNSNSWLCWVCD